MKKELACRRTKSIRLMDQCKLVCTAWYRVVQLRPVLSIQNGAGAIAYLLSHIPVGGRKYHEISKLSG